MVLGTTSTMPWARNILAGIKLMRMIRKGQLMLQGGIELSLADRFYALAGQIRSV